MRPRRRPIEPVRPSNADRARINDAIRVPRVRLIDDDGSQLGIKTSDEVAVLRGALRVAEDSLAVAVGELRDGTTEQALTGALLEAGAARVEVRTLARAP